jgi:hypothetical protein
MLDLGEGRESTHTHDERVQQLMPPEGVTVLGFECTARLGLLVHRHTS